MKNKYFKFLSYLYKPLQDAATSSFISCCFKSADIIFTVFQNLIQHYLKKDIYHKFSFVNGFTQIPPPL